MRWLRPASLLAALLAFGVSTGARAQSYSTSQHQSVLARRPSVSLSAGALQYDLVGTGTAPVLAARGELPLTHYFLVEGGLSAARPEQRLRGMTTLLAPEAQLQAQLPLAGPWVAPYVGAGVGAAIDRRTGVVGGTQRDLTLSAATGVRYWLSEDRGLRAELRLRRLGADYGGTAAEWTLGSSWRL
jgi:hypothetical protein